MREGGINLSTNLNSSVDSMMSLDPPAGLISVRKQYPVLSGRVAGLKALKATLAARQNVKDMLLTEADIFL